MLLGVGGEGLLWCVLLRVWEERQVLLLLLLQVRWYERRG